MRAKTLCQLPRKRIKLRLRHTDPIFEKHIAAQKTDRLPTKKRLLRPLASACQQSAQLASRVNSWQFFVFLSFAVLRLVKLGVPPTRRFWTRSPTQGVDTDCLCTWWSPLATPRITYLNPMRPSLLSTVRQNSASRVQLLRRPALMSAHPPHVRCASPLEQWVSRASLQ